MVMRHTHVHGQHIDRAMAVAWAKLEALVAFSLSVYLGIGKRAKDEDCRVARRRRGRGR